ncbi:alpha/beta hydrolase [Amycolatopsis rhabdoformis]|uniref:Alpha/beta hydrolase n=1 Tax=Amycolatopsis rhabdoformis TaxID=1448059 RepID=A0ABZ1II62_9PSEU|nr:alpha/beta hydrolase [Amycolatopsis rhabdoformis]WSE34111.1 alpha/beta hydrolase [Amycolatopsis rhabdoformis]
MGFTAGKVTRPFTFVAALAAALLLTSTTSSSATQGENDEQVSTAAQSSSFYPQSRPPAGFQSEFAEVNGFQMHYFRGGKGSPLVMFSGFPEDALEWRQQMTPLAENHTVIAIDMRGVGLSEVVKGGYDTAQLAKDAHQLLVQLHLDKGVQVIAHDLGEWVAYAYGAQYRSEVRSMAVMEATIPDDSWYQYPVLSPDPDQPEPWHFGFFQLPLAEKLIAGHERDLVHDLMLEYVAGDKSPFTDSDFDYYAHFLKQPGRLAAFLSIYRGIRTDIQQNKEFLAQGKLQMPILAIGGERSFGSEVPDQWSQYASHVEGHVLKGSGHFVTQERPQEVTSLLKSFLQK